MRRGWRKGGAGGKPARPAALLALAAAWVAGGCGMMGGEFDPSADLVIYGATVWDGTGAPPVRNAILQVGVGRVLAVEAAERETDPAELLAAWTSLRGAAAADRFIVAEDRFVIPGLVNVHGHVGGTWTPGEGISYRDFVLGELRRYARFGVTTINSLGGERDPAFAIRDRSWEDTPGPGDDSPHARLLVSGPVQSPATPERAALEIDGLAPRRPDWVKIRVDDNLGMTTKMPPEVYRSVIARAREHGLPVASHLFYLEDAKELLRAGTGMIAHSIRDLPVDTELLTLLHGAGICYVPTLTREVSTFAYGNRPAFFDDPFLLNDVDSTQIATLSEGARQAQIRASGAAESYGRALDVALANLPTVSSARIPVALGTDSGPLGRFQGYFEHVEMQMMADAQLTPEQILRAATGVAAGCLGRDDIGTLEEGRRADFVLLRADPLADVTNARRIDGVWLGGERVPGSRK